MIIIANMQYYVYIIVNENERELEREEKHDYVIYIYMIHFNNCFIAIIFFSFYSKSVKLQFLASR